MILLNVISPKGAVQKIDPELLPDNSAQNAINCDFETASCQPIAGMTSVATPSKTDPITIYKYGDSNWLNWTTDVDCIRGPIADDEDEVTYFVGDGIPKLTDASMATTGGADYPVDSYTLGVPAPTTAPTAIVTGEIIDEHQIIERAYVVTFVCEIGTVTPAQMEGPPSPTSNIIECLNSETSAIATANEIRADMISHFGNATRHTTGLQDTSTLPDDAVDVNTLLALVAVELTLFAAHNADAILAAAWLYHNAQGADKALVNATAPTTLVGAIERLNDLVTKYNDHEDETACHATIASIPADQVSNSTTYTTLTLPPFPIGDYNFTAKRIYRTQDAGEANTTDYLFVDEVDGNVLSFVDLVEGSALGASIPSTAWDMPPETLHSLKLHPAGFVVGASGNDLCVSVSYQPHAWPVGWRMKTHYPIIGTGIFGTSILAVTTANPYLFTGVEPDGLSQEFTEIAQSCVSKRGIVNIGGGIVYPSPDGLILVGMSSVKNITDAIMSRDNWQALNPSSILGAFHDGKYLGFYDTGTTQGGFIYDLETQDFTFINIFATATFVDMEDDTLYVLVDGQIYSWGTDTENPLTSTWRSRRACLPYSINPGFSQVKSNNYPIFFSLYVEQSGAMALKYTKSVTNGNPFPLPSGYKTEKIEIEITGAFRSCTISQTIIDLKRVTTP